MNIALIIFDADGTLRQRKDGDTSRPPLSDNEWEVIPGTIQRINRRSPGVKYGIVSNQASVGRGLIRPIDARQLLDDLAYVVFGGLPEDAIFMCPHTPEDNCECRKPEPLGLYAPMYYHQIGPQNTLYVGDAETDYLAAANASCHFAWADKWFGRRQAEV